MDKNLFKFSYCPRLRLSLHYAKMGIQISCVSAISSLIFYIICML